MKNLILAASLVFALSASAMFPINKESVNASVVCFNQEKEYKKIDTADVPANALKEISTKYSGYTITEAYVAEDGEYKVVLAKDKTTLKVYYSATGEYVKEEKK